MQNNYSNLNSTINRDGQIDGVITSSKGSNEKYKFINGSFVFSRELTEILPFNYGFIPNTTGAEGNPLDVIVISTNPIVQGTVVQLRIIGMLKMNDNGVVDNKIVCVEVGQQDVTYRDIISYEGLNFDLKNEIRNFFEIYKGSGQVTGLEWVGVELAKDFVRDNHISSAQN